MCRRVTTNVEYVQMARAIRQLVTVDLKVPAPVAQVVPMWPLLSPSKLHPPAPAPRNPHIKKQKDGRTRSADTWGMAIHIYIYSGDVHMYSGCVLYTVEGHCIYTAGMCLYTVCVCCIQWKARYIYSETVHI